MKETTRTEQAREQAPRCALNEEGFSLKKSHIRTPNLDDYGGYMIVDTNNIIVAGERYNLDLDDVEDWIKGE